MKNETLQFLKKEISKLQKSITDLKRKIDKKESKNISRDKKVLQDKIDKMCDFQQIIKEHQLATETFKYGDLCMIEWQGDTVLHSCTFYKYVNARIAYVRSAQGQLVLTPTNAIKKLK